MDALNYLDEIYKSVEFPYVTTSLLSGIKEFGYENNYEFEVESSFNSVKSYTDYIKDIMSKINHEDLMSDRHLVVQGKSFKNIINEIYDFWDKTCNKRLSGFSLEKISVCIIALVNNSRCFIGSDDIDILEKLLNNFTKKFKSDEINNTDVDLIITPVLVNSFRSVPLPCIKYMDVHLQFEDIDNIAAEFKNLIISCQKH